MKKLRISLAIISLIAMTSVVAFIVVRINQVKEKQIVKSESSNTELRIVNTTSDSVLVFLTLSGYEDSLATYYVQNVDSIFGITQTGLVGSFYLHASDSVSYTSIKRFSANVSFGAQPINCFSETWITGVNAFEFNLNTTQESIDISAIGGVNCLMSVSLIGGCNWVATNSFPDVRYFYNDSMYKNTNLVGVFPYGCTNCTNTNGMQSCVLKPEQVDSSKVCNPTRSSGCKGGSVVVKFNGFTN